MNFLRLFILCCLFASFFGCTEKQVPAELEMILTKEFSPNNRGALLLSDYSSLAELEEVVAIKYDNGKVILRHSDGQNEVTSVLKTGIKEGDFTRARDGGFWERVKLGMRTPYSVINRADLISIEILGRRRHMMFGEGDVAFYDLAERSVEHIRDEDRLQLSPDELSEKGYLNTFNHITAQALITTLFSERMADFISDVHERQTMPELISGNFTEAQRFDVESGPTDNYLDMINNQWGQELGKRLKKKYHINANTIWSSTLLTDYLNDIQNYYSYIFGISFLPFMDTDPLMVRFSNKINVVKEDVLLLVDTYYKEKKEK